MGNRFKKVIGLTLVSLMAAAMLAGCGKSDKTVASDWDYIAKKGEMTIGITYFAPMNFKDNQGELTGFETEFAKAVSEKLGVKANFIEIEWSAKETELNSKNIDCIWNGMTIDDERKANMDIATPYMTNKQVMVVKKGNEGKYKTAEDLKSATVVAEKKSAGEGVMISDEFFAQVKNATPVDTQMKALLEVKAGTADVALVDYVASIGSIGEGTDLNDLAVIGDKSFADEQYGIAFRKNSPQTLEKVNAAIQEVANEGKLAEFAAKYKLEEQLLIKPQ